jgi:hypothetical protein
MPRPQYYVTTWDPELEQYTPQKGVRTGPYTLFGLRRALRELHELGYEACRGGRPGSDGCGDPSVLVERRDE